MAYWIITALRTAALPHTGKTPGAASDNGLKYLTFAGNGLKYGDVFYKKGGIESNILVPSGGVCILIPSV